MVNGLLANLCLNSATVTFAPAVPQLCPNGVPDVFSFPKLCFKSFLPRLCRKCAPAVPELFLPRLCLKCSQSKFLPILCGVPQLHTKWAQLDYQLAKKMLARTPKVLKFFGILTIHFFGSLTQNSAKKGRNLVF